MLNWKWTPLALAALLAIFLRAPLFAHGDKPHGEITPKALGALYSAYLEIQAALAKDDLDAARKESQAFLNQPVKFPVELSHSVKAKDILADFKALNRAQDIAAYRKAFSPFSDRLALLMSEVKYQGGKAVFKFHCPMANANKGGNWLQAEKGVANPYFGAAMSTCGSLTNHLHESKTEEGMAKEKMVDPKAHPVNEHHDAHH